MNNRKFTTTIRITENVRAKLKEQADKIGMDMSSYIAYLVMYKDEKDKRELEAKVITSELLKTMGNIKPDVMAKLIKGDDK